MIEVIELEVRTIEDRGSWQTGKGGPKKASDQARLSELGLTYDQSADWQKLAEITSDNFHHAMKENNS